MNPAAVTRRDRPGPWTDPGTRRARSHVLGPLAAWLVSNWPVDRTGRVLDLGCGDLLLADLLPATWRLDGYDPAPAARTAARRSLERSGRPGQVHDLASELPEGAYDGVVVSSVVQYLADIDALGRLVADVARLLRTDGSWGAVVTDVVAPGGRRWKDASDLVRHLVPRVGARATLAGLARSARWHPGPLLQVPDREMESRARAAGLAPRRLPENLSPLSGRTSWVLVRGTRP